MRSIRFAGVMLLLVFVLSGAVRAEWEVFTLDSTGDVGKYTSIRIDPYDVPNIAYRNVSDGCLKYAMFNGVNWAFESPSDTSGMAYNNAMVLDHLGKAFIAHTDVDQMNLMMTQRLYNGEWETTIVDQDGITGDRCSISMDSQEYPNIAFLNETTGSIDCASWLGLGWGWIIRTIESGIASDFTAVALDQSNTIHVAYESEGANSLKCSRYNGIMWTIETVDPAVNVLYAVMELDSAGYAHIMYIDTDTADLKYARNSASGWTYQTIMTMTSAAIRSMGYRRDSSGKNHVCFYDLDDNLSYVTDETGAWTREKIDTAGNVGVFCSIDLDSQGRVHVAYYDYSNKDLKYARKKLAPNVSYDLEINDDFFTAGDLFRLDRTWISTMPAAVPVDEYILLDILQMYWFWPGWLNTPDFETWTVPVGGPTSDIILTFTWPDVAGEFSGIRFWGAFLESGTTNLLDYDMVEWGYGEAPMLTLTSTAFSNGQAIPTQYTCDGADLSPQLAWNMPNSSIQSFALIMDDPDAPGGTWTHWVIYHIPPNAQELQTGVPTDPTLPDGSRQGKNSWNTDGYRGPCPPSGPAHHYNFTLYALDIMPTLAAGASKQQLLDAMNGHILYQDVLMGTYQR